MRHRRYQNLAGQRYTKPPEHPAPTYPEYAQLLADAQAAQQADEPHIDGRKVYRMRMLRRDLEWKTAVLGYAGTGLGTHLEMHLLLLADERHLDPPLPQWLVERRAAEAEADRQREAERRALDVRDETMWEKTHADCAVEVEVRRNGTARPRHGRLHNLGHVVPLADAESGEGRRRRRHPAGRAICESETRAKPLDLSGGEGGPATCESCLKYTPQLRPLTRTDPA